MKAHQLLSDESKWTKHVFARTKTGKVTNPLSRSAVCFCLSAAIMRVYKGNAYAEAWRKLHRALGLRGDKAISGWNDNPKRKFSEVQRVLLENDL